MENALNPFKTGDRVITKFMGALVEVPVIQIFNREVQIRTNDHVLRWRTCKTVWYPPEKETSTTEQASHSPVSEFTPFSHMVQLPDPSTSVAPMPPGASVAPSESPVPTEPPLGITPPPVGQQFITVCGQEEAEELQRAKRKRRTARRKR